MIAFAFIRTCTGRTTLEYRNVNCENSLLFIYFGINTYLMLQVNEEQCSDVQCISDINCCLSSTLCNNGGTCIPAASKNQRFICKCTPGFKGKFCEERITSCRDYNDETRIPGSYTIVDNNDNPYLVFCDFNKQGDASWTLIQSYTFENKNLFASPFTINMPRNENNFTWFDYRLSLERMEYIHKHSLKWRITCNYDTEGVKYSGDFVRASTAQLSLFTLSIDEGECVPVQRLSISQHWCQPCNVHMIQTKELPLHFHAAKSSTICGSGQFTVVERNVCNEPEQNYFGNYNCINPSHKCSSSLSSTTQTWLG